jgi:hypothetical protein
MRLRIVRSPDNVYVVRRLIGVSFGLIKPFPPVADTGCTNRGAHAQSLVLLMLSLVS